MSWLPEPARQWAHSAPVQTAKTWLESALFRSPEATSSSSPSTLSLILDPPMPYWVTVFTQSCRIISLLILLPILLIGILDFAGYAVFRTLGLHRRRVRIQRQSKAGAKVPLGRAPLRRKPRVYQNDRHRPTDRSNIPSIVKAPLLSPGTYDAETLLRQRARSLSSASAEEEAKWVASGGEQARLTTLQKLDREREREQGLLTSPGSDGEGEGEGEGEGDESESQRGDYFGRAPRVGVDGALGLADTDVEESGTESGRESPVQRFSSLKGSSRRRGLLGGLGFTPVSTEAQVDPLTPTRTHPNAAEYSASVVSLGSSESPTSSSNGDKPHSVNMNSSWVGVEDEAEGEEADRPTA